MKTLMNFIEKIGMVLLFYFSIGLLIQCHNNNDDLLNQENITLVTNKPSTMIFVQGQILNPQSSTKTAYAVPVQQARVASTSYSWPYVSPEGWETARFSIRSDNKFPGYIDQSSTLYYGRPSGKQGKNRGRVASAYAYGHYNDRDYDYYNKNKKTGENIGLFRYVYDESGMKTQLAILEAPSVADILADEVDDLNAEISKGKNVEKNTQILNNVNALLDNGAEYLDKHVLWYVVKEVGFKNAWHVNGIISENEISKPVITNIPDNVEVDIHQQIHKDWNEIKTSIHIRSACDNIKINIPLKYEDIIEQDDFDIRVYDFYYKEYVINHTIIHNNNGITIEISNIPAELISELKNSFGDGLTVEIHSYCTKNDVWEQLSKSCVVSTGNPCTVNGQVTSAYNPDEKVDIKVMKPTGK